MTFTSVMRDKGRGRTEVVISCDSVPVLIIPLDDFLRLAATKYAQDLALERFELLSPVA